MEAKKTAVSNAPMVSQEYNLLVDGVIELAPHTDAKAFFDGLLDMVLEYAELYEASAVLSMSHRLLDTVEREDVDIVAEFDAVNYLDSEEMIAEYLTAALEDENPDVFLTAVADVARARGMTGAV
jgi:late competence protein required for DNA uptake (superfamily II DNA/RNA helicase)